MANRKGLGTIFGQDIDSVLDDINGNVSSSGSIKINISEIRPNPYQPRITFDQATLVELANSIKEVGVFTPLLVRKAINGYELVAGERRLRAAKLAKLTEVPCIIKEFNDSEMMEISLLENIQRENLSPIEEAKAYEQLQKKMDYTQDTLAKRLGKSRANITNTLRLLKLPGRVQELVQKGKLSYGHARALLPIEDEEKIVSLAKRIIDEQLSVRDVERIVNSTKPKTTKKNTKTSQNSYLVNVKDIMEKKLNTKVDVKTNKIIIHYKNTKELNRILEKIDCLDK